MYRKLAALVLAAALLCSCSARVTVQRYPAELPRAESPAATPTPEPVPTFTEEQKAYGSAALLTQYPGYSELLEDYYATKDRAERLRQKSRELYKAVHNMHGRRAAHPAGHRLDDRAGRGL